MPIALIAFDFDPLLRIADGVSVRWQTLALAAVVSLCLAAAGVIARRSNLRSDDLLYIAIAAAPGAIVGGRIGYLLLVPEAFASGPLSLFDPSVGGLELGLGVVGGLGTAAVVTSLLGAPVGRWGDAVTIPLLVAIAAGKATMALGGSGQGRPSDGSWATAYLGPGPWVDAAPAIPSHPAQIYEAVIVAVIVVALAGLRSLGLLHAGDGRRLLAGVAGWALARAVVSTTWRDPAVLGSLPAGGVLAVVIAAASLAGLIALVAWWPRRRRRVEAAAQPAWPDPETRPRF
ncbi:MAG TPA: prolipoprotein diacylglyceryl transferase family protein [Candidatus Limnocylindrales bacterium]|nr:prolipoprotein diacylglyceryl transferase family protein [Candidatus Limnocylindrales bacterium]